MKFSSGAALTSDPLRKKVSFFATSNYHYEIAPYCFKGTDFPVVSITGRWCALRCKHCNARILERMIPAETPDKLRHVLDQIRLRGNKGVVISGGSNRDGSVPLKHVASVIEEVKRGSDLKVYLHTGLVDEDQASLIRWMKVDAALCDVVGDEETIAEVLAIDAKPEDMFRGMRLLLNYGVPTVPHLVVGMNHGKIRGEHRALRAIADANPSAAAIVIMTPYPGTPFEDESPPDVKSVIEFMGEARRTLSDTLLALGCMRPRTESYRQVEISAIRFGYDGLVFPSKDAIDYAVREGMDVKFRNECCAALVEENRHHELGG